MTKSLGQGRPEGQVAGEMKGWRTLVDLGEKWEMFWQIHLVYSFLSSQSWQNQGTCEFKIVSTILLPWREKLSSPTLPNAGFSQPTGLNHEVTFRQNRVISLPEVGKPQSWDTTSQLDQITPSIPTTAPLAHSSQNFLQGFRPLNSGSRNSLQSFRKICY